MKIVNEALLSEFRACRRCQWCQRPLRRPAEPAHIWTKGMGGATRLDIRINLVALGGPWDCACHHRHHMGHRPTRDDLVGVVAAREGLSQEVIRGTILRLRRSHAEGQG